MVICLFTWRLYNLVGSVISWNFSLKIAELLAAKETTKSRASVVITVAIVFMEVPIMLIV